MGERYRVRASVHFRDSHWRPRSEVYTRSRHQGIRGLNLIDRLSRFSHWSKAVRAIARLQRLARRTKTHNDLKTVEERRKAELFTIKAVHNELYPDDIAVLNKGLSDIRINSTLHCLNVFVDDEGVLRVGGRLQESSLPFGVKHPAVLPKDHHVTSLIIGHYHNTIQHQGRAMTINEIRSNGLWIIGCSSAVAAHIHRCVKCRRMRRRVSEQKMANLLQDRVEPSPPFTFSGMDCFGPFLVKAGRKQLKIFGLLFTCMSSRAFHLEALEE